LEVDDSDWGREREGGGSQCGRLVRL
jgi:hypothetical protein